MEGLKRTEAAWDDSGGSSFSSFVARAVAVVRVEVNKATTRNRDSNFPALLVAAHSLQQPDGSSAETYHD